MDNVCTIVHVQYSIQYNVRDDDLFCSTVITIIFLERFITSGNIHYMVISYYITLVIGIKHSRYSRDWWFDIDSSIGTDSRLPGT